MKRYTPDFPEMMRLCETNFSQLRRLLPRNDAPGETVSYQVANAQYRLTIVESTRYTTLVAIEQTAPAITYWSLPSLTVRLYHDAMVAEVCSSQQIFRFKARYDYPNKKLHLESLLTLPLAGEARVRILQITDTHLFAEKHETLLGVNTWESYQAVLDAIHAGQHEYDLIVATGDLAQDQTAAAYQHFAEGIASFRAPCVWLPGNHDFQPAMYSALQEAGISPAKRVFIGDQWQILLLDSQVFGVPHGELSDFQLEWLERKLADAPERHTLLLLHHHPLPSGCSWLDQHSLRNAAELDSVLANYPRVKYLLCGHIHQELDLDWNGRRLLATPSTCVQFKPHCANFTLDTIGPGWRTLELYAEGSLETQVHRLPGTQFRPDTASEGY